MQNGDVILHYRIVEKIGEGGMGAVWKATDTTLGRDVALKFLPAGLAGDPERLQRFEREAKVLAALNHPNIAAIYGLHQHGTDRFLAMEFVPGEDLSQRLSRGALPVDEAIDVARKIAEALEAAHDQGIVHRDLKPANVKLAPDGSVKVLDFGLAKALDPVASTSGGAAQPSMSPTITSLGTVVGVILGTAAYMSPEQAKGKPVDRRTDIWAFGCLFHEMLTGRRLFQGETISEVLAAVIMAPLELGDLPAAVPSRVRRLIQRCLERDPRRRLRDIGEARVLLEEVVSGAPEPLAEGTPVAASPARPRWILPAAVAGTALVVAIATFGIVRAFGTAPVDRPVRRFEMAAHGPFRSSNQSRLVEISPDGKAIAWSEGGKLLIRPLARVDAIPIATASEPSMLFWSHDARSLGYVANGKIWTVPAEGGTGTTIADIRKPLTGGSSAAWCPGDDIWLGTGEGGLFRVSARGGDLKEMIPLEKGEADFHHVSCLPDGAVIFAPHLSGARPSKLVLWADGRRKELLTVPADQDIGFPVYSPDGFILFRRQPANAGIWALPFSLDDHAATGEPFMVAPEADVPSVSGDGTLVAVRGGGSRSTRLVWKDRNGKTLGPIGPEQDQWPFPELSPDGRRVAIAANEKDVGDVWIHDVERGTRTRLGVSPVDYSIQGWSPDAKTILYNEGTSPPIAMKLRNADGSGEARTLGDGWAAAWSADDRYVLFTNFATDTFWDLHYLDTRGDGKPVAFLKAAGDQLWPRLSPDGRFVAYVSDEGGGFEVYLKPFPTGEGKWQVSVGGGMWPRWSPRGDRLYYANGDTLMEVDVASGAEPRLGAPREIFTRRPLGWPLIFGWFPGFDVTDDGERFVVVESVDTKVERGGILVIENWVREFARSKP